jgi:4-amino-4-deoxy-L-arabinose transferase-like glycosyltransferase
MTDFADPPRADALSLSDSATLAVALAVLTAGRVFAAAAGALSPDEAYYWLWSRAPALGYFDHPPMIAWWIHASTALAGDTPLGVRLAPILAALAASAAVYATARELGQPQQLAARAALWFNATLLIGVGSFAATPDSPSVLFWATDMWLLARLRRTGQGALWLAVGAVAGLGCLSKYTNFFFGLGVLAWLLGDRSARRWLFSPWLWAGGAVALAVFGPNLLWNASHGWITFDKQFGRLSAGRLGLGYLLEFVAGQFALLNPLLALLAGAGALFALDAWRTDRRTPKSAPDAALFLVLLSAPLALYMVVHAFHDRVQANWPGPLYPGLAILATLAADRPRAEWLRRAGALVAPLGVVLSLAGLILIGLPAPSFWPRTAPNVRLLAGWRYFAAEVEAARRAGGADWIATTNYGLAGELAFELRGGPPVAAIAERARYAYAPAPSELEGSPALLVIESGKQDIERAKACFGSVEPRPDILRRVGGRVAQAYVVMVVSRPRVADLREGCW